MAPEPVVDPSSAIGEPPRRGRGRPRKERSEPFRASTPAGSTTSPREDAPKVSGARNRLHEPLSPKEGRLGLYTSHKAAAKILRSEVELQESDFDEAGDAAAEVANYMFPKFRLVFRYLAPLILIGALIDIWARIVSETPWWARMRLQRAARKAARDQRRAGVPPTGPAPAAPATASPVGAAAAPVYSGPEDQAGAPLPPAPTRPVSLLRRVG